MTIWEADFYRRPLQDARGQPLWELIICDRDRSFRYRAFCPQAEANAAWLRQQIEGAVAAEQRPDRLLVFRPQSLSLLQAACEPLNITVEASRYTPVLKSWLADNVQEYFQQPNYTGEPYNPLKLDRPAPNPLPENLWGEQWRLAAIAAGDFERSFIHEPIPFLQLPPELLPLQVGVPSTTLIPGVIVYSGRRALPLAQWLHNAQPAFLNYIPGDPDGLILEAGLVDRWVLVTFDDPEVKAAAQTFAQRKQASRGLHFLLVQPDDSGITYTGLWLLQQSASL